MANKEIRDILLNKPNDATILSTDLFEIQEKVGGVNSGYNIELSEIQKFPHSSPITYDTEIGIIADSGGIQGGTPLTAQYNIISTVSTIGDSVTLPIAVIGQRITIINRGVNILDIFPAINCILNNGTVNSAEQLSTDSSAEYFAISNTKWVSL